MNMDTLILNLHACIGLIIAMRVWFVSKTPDHTFRHNLLAYSIGLVAISIPTRIWYGEYSAVDISEMMMNILILIILIGIKGNITRLFK